MKKPKEIHIIEGDQVSSSKTSTIQYLLSSVSRVEIYMIGREYP